MVNHLCTCREGLGGKALFKEVVLKRLILDGSSNACGIEMAVGQRKTESEYKCFWQREPTWGGFSKDLSIKGRGANKIKGAFEVKI